MKHWYNPVLGAVVIVAVYALFLHHDDAQYWLAIHTGTQPVMCGQTACARQPFYGFFSGVGSDIGEVTLIAAVVTGWRHINCHVKGCWRRGTHLVNGTPYKVCAKHHPEVPDKVTHAHIVQAHQDSKQVSD